MIFLVMINKNITKKYLSKGIVLIETVLYIVLLAVVMGVIVQMLLSLSGVYKNIKLTRELESSGAIVMETILREVRNASSVTVAQSVFNSDNGKLALVGINEAGDPYEVAFDLNNNLVRIAMDSGTAVALSARSATTSALRFSYVSNTNSEAVRVEITMTGNVQGVTKTEKFYGFAVLRGSY